MVDAGVSGFRGRHRADDTTALGHFLKLVESGRVPKGSYLIVENLDRLSREKVSKALTLLLNLLNDGIKVVQLQPTEVVFESGEDIVPLIIAILELSRGNSESQMKSIRVGAAWDEKKKKARANKTAVSSACPRWLRRVGDRYEPIPDRVAVIRRIFDLAADGYGVFKIAEKLTADKVPPFGRQVWRTAYLHSILRKRTVLGEYRPTKRGQPDGEPIADYYPAVVTEDKWLLANAGLDERSRFKGRPAKNQVNLFAGLLYSADDGDSLIYGVQGRYCNLRSRDSATKDTVTFPIAPLEEAILNSLREVDPSALRSDGEKSTAEQDLVVLSAKEAELTERLRRIQDRIAAGDDLDLLVSAAKTIQAEKQAVTTKLLEAKAKLNESRSESLGQCHGLIEALAASTDVEQSRLRLRSAIRRVVRRIDILIRKNGLREMAAMTIRFNDSDLLRTVFIQYRQEKKARGKKKQPPFLRYRTKVGRLEENIDVVVVKQQLSKVLLTLLDDEVWCREVEPGRLSKYQYILAKNREYRRKKKA